MAGFKIRITDDLYVGFIKNELIRTNIENAHIYHSVLSTEEIIKFMNKQGDFTEKDTPAIVDKFGKIIKVIHLER